MAATQTSDNVKIKQDIVNLEIEDAAIEKQILNGTLTQDVGQKKRNEIALQIEELTRRLNPSTPPEDATTPSDKKEKTKHEEIKGPVKKPEEERPDTAENTPTAIPDAFNKAFEKDPASTLDPTVTPTKKTGIKGIIKRNAVPFIVAGPAGAVAAETVRKANSASGGKMKETMLSTSSGALVKGKLVSRSKERMGAKKQIQNMENAIRDSQKNKKSFAQRVRNWFNPPPANKPPEPGTEEQAAVSEVERLLGPSLKTPETPIEATKPTQNLGILNWFKKKPSTKNQKPDAAPSIKKTTAIKHGKTAVKWYSYFTPIGLAFHLGRHGVKKIKTANAKQEESTPTTQPKEKRTATFYQRLQNAFILKIATERKGYDRLRVFRKIRDLKLWKNRNWARPTTPRPQTFPYTPGNSNAAALTTGAALDIDEPRYTPGYEPSPTPPPASHQTYSRISSVNRMTNTFFPNNPVAKGKKKLKAAARKKVSGLNKRLGRKLGQKVGKQVGKQLARKAATQLATKAIMNPVGLTVVAVVLVFLLLIVTIVIIITSISGDDSAFGGGGIPPETPISTPPILNGAPLIPNFTLGFSTADNQVNKLDLISYTVTPSYTGDAANISTITIFEDIPAGTEFVTSDGTATYDPDSGRVSWSLAEERNRTSFTFVLKALTDDTLIKNFVYATQAGTSSGGGSTTPTTDNCNGAYTLANPVGNFGDPDCAFATNKEQAMDELYELLKAQDPANAYNWYLKIIPCESVPPYNPNSHSSAEAIGAPDSAGVWGMFSMGRGLNGEFDHGDVPWRNQVSNALAYGNNLKQLGIPLASEGGGYWECWNQKHLQ